MGFSEGQKWLGRGTLEMRTLQHALGPSGGTTPAFGSRPQLCRLRSHRRYLARWVLVGSPESVQAQPRCQRVAVRTPQPSWEHSGHSPRQANTPSSGHTWLCPCNPAHTHTHTGMHIRMLEAHRNFQAKPLLVIADWVIVPAFSISHCRIAG